MLGGPIDVPTWLVLVGCLSLLANVGALFNETRFYRNDAQLAIDATEAAELFFALAPPGLSYKDWLHRKNEHLSEGVPVDLLKNSLIRNLKALIIKDFS